MRASWALPAAGTAALPHQHRNCFAPFGTSSLDHSLVLTKRAMGDEMSETVFIEPAGAKGEAAGISWAAVLAGAAVSLAMTLVMLSLGTGLGLSMVSPWAGSGVSATTFKISTGLYLIVIAMISSSLGGYISGRLRYGWASARSDEVYFRDTAHGFVTWAVASVLGALLLGSVATGLLSSATMGATQGATVAAAQAGPMDGYVDRLLRSSNNAAGNPAGSEDARPELSRLLTSSFRNGGTIGSADQQYVARVVGSKTGLTQAEAEQRVNEVITQAKSDLDAARKAAAQLAFWLTASLFLGAFCASLAATEGGGLRDGTWGRRNQERR